MWAGLISSWTHKCWENWSGDKGKIQQHFQGCLRPSFVRWVCFLRKSTEFHDMRTEFQMRKDWSLNLIMKSCLNTYKNNFTFDQRMWFRFFPNPNNMEVRKKPQHTSTHTSLMDQRKMQQQHTLTCYFWLSFWWENRIYLFKDAPYLITQMAVSNNIDVWLPFICSLFFSKKIFALIGRLEHLSMVKILWMD